VRACACVRERDDEKLNQKKKDQRRVGVGRGTLLECPEGKEGKERNGGLVQKVGGRLFLKSAIFRMVAFLIRNGGTNVCPRVRSRAPRSGAQVAAAAICVPVFSTVPTRLPSNLRDSDSHSLCNVGKTNFPTISRYIAQSSESRRVR